MFALIMACLIHDVLAPGTDHPSLPTGGRAVALVRQTAGEDDASEPENGELFFVVLLSEHPSCLRLSGDFSTRKPFMVSVPLLPCVEVGVKITLADKHLPPQKRRGDPSKE